MLRHSTSFFNTEFRHLNHLISIFMNINENIGIERKNRRTIERCFCFCFVQCMASYSVIHRGERERRCLETPHERVLKALNCFSTHTFYLDGYIQPQFLQRMTVHCGTPDTTGAQSDLTPFTTTLCFLKHREESIQCQKQFIILHHITV